MRIFIITMEDPVYTNTFFEDIFKVRHRDIVGLAIAKGNRLKIGKDRSKPVYLLTLVLVMGIPFFLRNSWTTLSYALQKKLSNYFRFMRSPSIVNRAGEYGIPVYRTSNPNAESFLEILRQAQPDVIINQSQFILKKALLDIPKIGVVNRHNALLPKNRGRLTPFWVLYKKEKETGVSIHFVDEGIDSGDIIVQERFPVDKRDSFQTLVNKNYRLASRAMLKALDMIEQNTMVRIKNDDQAATYNTVPGFRTALKFRLSRLNIFSR